MTDAPIAGWYPDPRNAAADWRWWNGRDWTHETAAREAAEVAAPIRRAQDWGWDAPVAGRASSTVEATGSANTVWIWLLAFSLYISGIVTGVVQGVGLVTLAQDDSTRVLVGVASAVAGLIPLWVFADLDGRVLRRRGFAAPSVLWMILLPPLVYFVVRGRKLRRRGARSVGPERALLIVVAVQVLGGIATGLLIYSMLPALTSQLG